MKNSNVVFLNVHSPQFEKHGFQFELPCPRSALELQMSPENWLFQTSFDLQEANQNKFSFFVRFLVSLACDLRVISYRVYGTMVE